MEKILILLLIIPILFFVVITLLPKNFKALSTAHIIASITYSLTALYAVSNVVNGDAFYAFSDMIFLDSVGGVFLTIIAITGFLVNMYAVKYVSWELEKNVLHVKDVKLYFQLTQIFIFTMTFSVISNNIALMWVAMEATTLSSVFLIAIHKSKKTTESGWKYIVLCTIGLAFALYATVLLYSAGAQVVDSNHNAMLWSTLIENADKMNSNALKLIFVFALVGYGAKAGLAPTHTWLPDAHSEGPAPISALLSGILLKCALLCLLRYYAIVGNSLVGFSFVEIVMMASALLTIYISSLFLLRQHDVKRMFAYHSIAHMGVVAFGLGAGGFWGIFAALFHCFAHSTTKALAFCSTGNLMHIYGTRDMEKMSNLIRVAPITAILFGVSICSLVGVPAFNIFVSEFMMIKTSIVDIQTTKAYVTAFLLCIGLVIIFVADFSHFNMVTFGRKETTVLSGEVSWKANLPLIVLATIIVITGLLQFESWTTLLTNATNIIMQK
ncbi:MAG: proton-conducting transporter membrane subunit [Campylobacteraceae bacterium]